MIFNMNGGGTALNFRVVGGTSAPSDLKENTIWLNTNTTITEWFFSKEKPGIIDGEGLTTESVVDGTYTSSAGEILQDANYTSMIYFVPSGCKKVCAKVNNYQASNAFNCFLDIGWNVLKVLPRKAGITFYDVPDNAMYFAVSVRDGETVSATNADVPNGTVWISTGTSSSVEFNALKKNGIQVYPLTAKQYVNGAWADKAAKTYQGGAWVDWWNGELFDNGNQYDDITGGWVQGQYQVYGGENATGGTIAIGSTIQLKDNGGQNCVSARTNKKIDLARFNTVTATFTGNGYVFAANATSGIPAVLGTEKANSIDVSALSGEYYVGVMVRNYMEMTVSAVKLS